MPTNLNTVPKSAHSPFSSPASTRRASNGNQGDREEPAGQQVVDEIGDQERIPIEVAFRRHPQQGGEERLAE